MLISTAHAQDNLSADVAVASGESVPYELSAEKQLQESLIFLLFLFVVFYFVLIRPQQKKIKAHQAMTGGLGKGDKIITSGGLVGKIQKIDDHLITLEIGKDVEVQVMRGSVSSIYTDPAAPTAPKTPKPANDK